MTEDVSLGLTLPKGKGRNRAGQMQEFANKLMEINDETGFKVSARGWCYQLEGFRLINKDLFPVVEKLINECRDNGILPIDFTAEEEGRKFSGVEEPDTETPAEYLGSWLNTILSCENQYTPNWWEDEKYYIQMIVEKIDLKTLFEPVCKDYKIPIATSKGWSSKLQRAEYARRFKLAEEDGHECILLYCGDFDPDGLRISEFLRSNLEDLSHIVWEDGTDGYDPSNLTIERFGLNYDFITENKLTWIDNLITGSGKNLASPSHKNHYQRYVQEYLKKYGVRKCEANALVVRPESGREMCRQAIERFLGKDAISRFGKRKKDISARIGKLRQESGLLNAINECQELINDEDDEEE